MKQCNHFLMVEIVSKTPYLACRQTSSAYLAQSHYSEWFNGNSTRRPTGLLEEETA